MSLTLGSRLGVYEVVAAIGSGGMGEVYRARDTKLQRDVALKVLPESFALDPERLARFTREAHVLALLNHPNIAAIYGLEETDGVHALVLELVEGPTLADRIAHGPLPLDEALPIARQIAEALEAAHEHGIIHRDLKPANIKVKDEGTVKVLDFGLAKALEHPPSAAGQSMAPTVTSPAVMTGAGVILGTAAYMSPEQAKGKPTDRRSDIWAFGCVLYEMLTGRRAFAGDDVSDTLAAILRAEPDWNALPADAPPAIGLLLSRCLAKDRNERLRDIGDARLDLREVARQHGVAPAAAPQVHHRHPALAALMLVTAGLLGGLVVWFLQPVPASPVTHLSVALPPGQTLLSVPALSPDGRLLAYATEDALYVRNLDQRQAAALPDTKGVQAPFFSPDGRWIGFWAGGQYKRVSVAGGSPLVICDAPAGTHGAAWRPDDTIIITGGFADGLFQVTVAGGTREPLTKPRREAGEVGHWWPQLLPDGEHVLFTAWSSDGARTAVLSLETRDWVLLPRGGASARYLSTGHLVYGEGATLLAVPFDARRLEIRGVPVPVLDGVNGGFGRSAFAVSQAGTVVYLRGGAIADRRGGVPRWVDRQGKVEPFSAAADSAAISVSAGVPGSQIRLAPDGLWFAISAPGATTSDIWVYDTVRGTRSRLTAEGSINSSPVWTPDDAHHITFNSTRGSQGIFIQPIDRQTGAQQILARGEGPQEPGSWSADGRLLAYDELHPVSGTDIWILPRDGAPARFLVTPFNESSPRFSPDGRWIAYESDESGRSEIYVQPYPGPGGRVQVSSDGGSLPVWSADGRELFYRNGGQVLAVEVRVNADDGFEPGRPTVLFEGRYLKDFDVAPDGRRFLMLEATAEDELTQINVVLNWHEEVKRLVPRN